MFIFSGVFFSVDRFPDYVEPVTWILPMTHLIEVVRPLTAGQDLGLAAALGHLSYLLALCVAAFLLAHRRLRDRQRDQLGVVISPSGPGRGIRSVSANT